MGRFSDEMAQHCNSLKNFTLYLALSYALRLFVLIPVVGRWFDVYCTSPPQTKKQTKIDLKYQHRRHVSLVQPLIPRTVKLRLFSSSVLPQTDDELLSPAKDWRLTMRWIARPSLRNLKISPPPIRGKDKLSQSSSQEFRIDSY